MNMLIPDSLILRGAEYGVRHFHMKHHSSLMDFLGSDDIPNERVKELLGLGAIYLNNVRCGVESLTSPLEPGDHLRVHLEPRRFFNGSLKNRIVEVHPDYYIVDKPGGLPSHPLVDNTRENLLALLTEELNEKLFITHRLDVVTKGLILIARNEKAQSRINELIKNRSIRRIYKAVTENPLAPGRYVHFMEVSPRAPKKVRPVEFANSLKCELEILSCDKNAEGTYNLTVSLITGRPQQIRAQLAAEGAPICGDTSYGSLRELKDPLTHSPCIDLTAISIEGMT